MKTRSVIKCIKDNRNKFGFGYYHKKNHYVTYSGKGSFDINDATLYGHDDDEYEIPFDDYDFEDNWKEYYKIIPINIVPVKK
jgi:hypothetical protein